MCGKALRGRVYIITLLSFIVASSNSNSSSSHSRNMLVTSRKAGHSSLRVINHGHFNHKSALCDATSPGLSKVGTCLKLTWSQKEFIRVIIFIRRPMKHLWHRTSLLIHFKMVMESAQTTISSMFAPPPML